MEYEVIARGEFSRVRVQVVGGRSSRYIWVYYTMRNFKNVYRDNSCELWKYWGYLENVCKYSEKIDAPTTSNT